MNKYSKKLVSKCIYIQILKCTNTDLLETFMSSSGWDLVYNWLVDSITKKNWILVQEVLELFLLCPVDTTRLKSNSAPKVVKNLSISGGTSGKCLFLFACPHFRFHETNKNLSPKQL